MKRGKKKPTVVHNASVAHHVLAAHAPVQEHATTITIDDVPRVTDALVRASVASTDVAIATSIDHAPPPSDVVFVDASRVNVKNDDDSDEKKRDIDLALSRDAILTVQLLFILLSSGQSNATGSSKGQIPTIDNSVASLRNLSMIGPQSFYKIVPAKHPGAHHTILEDSVTPAIVIAQILRDTFLPPNSKILIVCGAFAGAGFVPQSKTWGGRNNGNYSFDLAFRPGGSKPVSEWSSTSTYGCNDMVMLSKESSSSFICVASNTNQKPNASSSSYWVELAYGYNYKGSWNATTTYQPFDVVNYNNGSYVCATTSVLNQPPSSSTPFWNLQNRNPNPTTTDTNLAYDLVKTTKLAKAQSAWAGATLLGLHFQQGETDSYFPMNAPLFKLSQAQEQARQDTHYEMHKRRRVAFFEYVRGSVGHSHLPISDGLPLASWVQSAPSTCPGLVRTMKSIPLALSARRNNYLSFAETVDFGEVTTVFAGDGMNVHYTCDSIRKVLGPKHAQALIRQNQLLTSETEKYKASLAKKSLGDDDDEARKHAFASDANRSLDVDDNHIIVNHPLAPLDWMPALSG
jgi:hypothetical protein